MKNLCSFSGEANEWLEEEAPTAGIIVSRKKWKALEELIKPIFDRITEKKNLARMAKLAEEMRVRQAKLDELKRQSAKFFNSSTSKPEL